MKFQKCYIFLLSILICGNCVNNRTLLKDGNKPLNKQYKYLVEKSKLFLSQPGQSNFEMDLYNYLKEYKKYNFYNGRELPVILAPVISNDKKQAIAFVAVRKYDSSKADLEYINLISSKFENNKWVFALKEGWVYSFSYLNDTIPRLSNNKLAEYTIRNLMLEGYFRKNRDDKSIFSSAWYVF